MYRFVNNIRWFENLPCDYVDSNYRVSFSILNTIIYSANDIDYIYKMQNVNEINLHLWFADISRARALKSTIET